MNRPYTFGLRGRLVLIVGVGIVITFTILGLFRLYMARQSITEEINRSGRERVVLVAESLSNLIVGYDYSNIESLAERIVNLQDVQQITIRNRDGKIMATRNSSRYEPGAKGLRFQAPVLFSGERVGRVELLVSLERLEKTIHETYTAILIELGYFVAILGLLIYGFTSWAILKPIRGFRDLMTGILHEPSGAAPRKLEIDSKDEIGELSAIFNNMNDKVFDYQRRLQDKYLQADSALVAINEQLKARTTELEKALAMVEQLATTDCLTKLPNRRHFDNYFATNFPRAVRFKEPLCLILLDVDNFKQINDQNGHATGDYVLQELGALFAARTRETDICARLGGDEFAFLLYHTHREEASVLAQDLLRRVRAHPFVMEGKPLAVTLSIGVAELTPDIASIQAFYEVADKALYEAKRRGRDQAAIYPFDTTDTPRYAEPA